MGHHCASPARVSPDGLRAGIVVAVVDLMAYRILDIGSYDWPLWSGQVMVIEEECFESARRGTADSLATILAEDRSIGAITLQGEHVVGFCLGGPLELFPEMEWAREDAEFGRETTLYAADLIVAPSRQGQGIGAALKTHQVERARSARYKYIAGRYRVGLAEGMGHISSKLGAYQVQYLRDSYADDLEPRDAVYYRIDL